MKASLRPKAPIRIFPPTEGTDDLVLRFVIGFSAVRPKKKAAVGQPHVPRPEFFSLQIAHEWRRGR